MKDKANKRVAGFLVNDDFINYVINPSLSLIELWEEFFRNHPEQIEIANEARQILLGQKDYVILPTHEANDLKFRIFEKCGFGSLN